MIKRILAIGGILLLIFLYIATLVCAIVDTSQTMQLFFASVIATIMVPALLWTYTFIYRLIHGKNEEPDEESSPNDDTDTNSCR